ncbi:MAG TPA: hypothetical protein PKG95_08110 [Anaerolineaceae bacterium]|jgi:hypothetical protein|nr:hypothetical protein [Anaerolineaceae bacterium]
MLNVEALDQLSQDLQNPQGAIRMDAVQRARAFMAQNAFRRQVIELLENTASRDADSEVAAAARAALAEDARPHPRPRLTGTQAFEATCSRGHRHYYNKDDYCSGTTVWREMGAALDTVVITCKTCGTEFVFKLDCGRKP